MARESDGGGRRPWCSVVARYVDVGKGHGEQPRRGEPLERRDGFLTRGGRLRDVLGKPLDAPLGAAGPPVGVCEVRMGLLLFALADASRLRCLLQPPLEFGDGRSDCGAEGGEVFVRGSGAPGGLRRPLREFGHEECGPVGLRLLTGHCALGVGVFAQRGPQRRQQSGVIGECLAYGAQSRCVGGKVQGGRGLGELGRRTVGVRSRPPQLRGPRLLPGTGPVGRVGRGGDPCVGMAQVVVARYRGEFGVQHDAALGHGAGLLGQSLPLGRQRVELGVQFVDPGAACLFPCSFSHVLGTLLGPASGECADPEAPVRADPGVVAVGFPGGLTGPAPVPCGQPDRGQQARYRLLAHGGAPHVRGVDRRAQRAVEAGPAEQPDRVEQHVVAVRRDCGAVRPYPGVEEPRRLQRGLQPRPVGVGDVRAEVDEPPQRGAEGPVAHVGRTRVRRRRATLAARFESGQLLDRQPLPFRPRRLAVGQSGSPVGQAGGGGAMGLGRRRTGRQGAVQ